MTMAPNQDDVYDLSYPLSIGGGIVKVSYNNQPDVVWSLENMRLNMILICLALCNLKKAGKLLVPSGQVDKNLIHGIESSLPFKLMETNQRRERRNRSKRKSR